MKKSWSVVSATRLARGRTLERATRRRGMARSCWWLVLAFAPHAAAQSYTLTDLGTLGGSAATDPFPGAFRLWIGEYGPTAYDGAVGVQINNHGQIVGSVVPPGGLVPETVPFLWDRSMVALPMLESIVRSDFASAINDLGQVIGQDLFPTSPPGQPVTEGGNRTLLWTAADPSAPPRVLPSALSTQAPHDVAIAINNAGQVAGSYQAFQGPFGYSGFFGYVTETSTMQTTLLPDTFGQGSVIVHGLNNSGRVVGETQSNSLGDSRAFTWSGGGALTLLPPLANGYQESATAVNDSGVVVGFADDESEIYLQPVRWTGGPPQALLSGVAGAVAGTANAINNHGDIVGDYFDAAFVRRAFLWRAGVFTDLNSLMPPGAPFSRLSAALDINESGQIVGVGRGTDGRAHAFLLAPSAVCYANCDGSTTAPVLNVNDFVCFLNRFAAANPYANCDESTASPVLNVLDFACFLNRFAAGCM